MREFAWIAALLLVMGGAGFGQGTKYRTGVFPHHSVGGVLWDRSQYSNLTPPTTIPAEVTAYNRLRGLTGSNAFSFSEMYAPGPSSINDNNWYRWDKIFNGSDPDASLSSILKAPIVVVKTCYLSQQYMKSADSTEAYKAHIRSIVKVMAKHPETLFVMWNNYPAATDGASQRAVWSAQFSVWMKDVLAAGKDSYGAFPVNVYVFDVFRKLADPVTGVCPANYGSWNEGPGGDHPSNDAVAVVDPQFVRETCDAAIAYERLTSVDAPGGRAPARFLLNQNYPNPFNPSTEISYQIPGAVHVRLTVSDITGRDVATLVDDDQTPGVHRVSFNAGTLSSGVYMYRLRAGSFTDAKRMSLVR
jgi:hypothetical protein